MVQHHFLLVTFPAQGHINPSLQFAKRLIGMGVHVTLATSVYMHRRMNKTTPINGLTFATFSDGFDHGFKSKGDANPKYEEYMWELKRRGSEYVAHLISSAEEEGRPPFTCVVHTPLLQWAAEVARGLHLPTAMLWIQPATVFDIYYYYFKDDKYIKNKLMNQNENPWSLIELPGLPPLSTRELPSFIVSAPDAYSFILPCFEEQFKLFHQQPNSTSVLVNTFQELEPQALTPVDCNHINMMAIGPLIPSAFLDRNDPSDTCFGGDLFKASPREEYVEWLDSKAESSVIYVSFGSMCVLSKRQMGEIARGLLESGRPFLWVVREKEDQEKEEDELREYREELEGKGKIVRWCKQVEVLSHSSVGCFVTHCGWNSSLESLASGVPVVGFPQWADQNTNGKLIEDVWKTGVRVRVNNIEGVVESEEIRRCLDVVMGSGEKGEELRRNAKKWRELAVKAVNQGGSSDINLRAFVDEHHFLFVTFTAQGHINPFLQFAKRLIGMGVHVTLATSVYMHRCMNKTTPITGLTFATFSDGFDDGFKPKGDANPKYEEYMSELKRRGSEYLAHLISSAKEEGRSPFTCVVHTPLLEWAAEVARGLHLPTAMLWVQPATLFDILYYYFKDDKYIKNKLMNQKENPSGLIELPGLPPLSTRELPSFLVSPPEAYSFILPGLEEQFKWLLQQPNSKSVVLVNTFQELEPQALPPLDCNDIDMIAIGPLFLSAGKDPSDKASPREEYIEWLDSKAESSVIYVSFGSMCVLSKRQMGEIARGLLGSGRPFLWVVREREGQGEEEDELREYRKELVEKGKIVGWCKQVEVLSHSSVGCFVTHCGWNSSVESLASGVPMVGFPQWADQNTNGKLIEDVWKIGVRVRVNNERVLESEEIRRCLDVVMGSGEKGEELRRNAKEWRELAVKAVNQGGSSDINLRAFLDEVGARTSYKP
ncbi:Crocetin glucosyltransferase, chloroplastic [Senna tora]|uniref:Crocetin glucosyltransferase, chloroplastic n=1 Tax=Senna tora TaxID=362788 RepID=A0A834X236_9FABA|nr:Crocetin glucosyltransferase, chloroplastic [Senna tora]